VFAPYIQHLVSKDFRVRTAAARTLATVAPPALEPLLLGFATAKDSTIRQFAPMALANLATKASLSALSQRLIHGEPASSEYFTAANYLGKTHDPAWPPLLLAVADQHGSTNQMNVSLRGNFRSRSGSSVFLGRCLGQLYAGSPPLRFSQCETTNQINSATSAISTDSWKR
jgi:HEAT repeat protein